MRPKPTPPLDRSGHLAPELLGSRPDVALDLPLLTDDEAANLLSLSPATLKKWRRTRRGPRYYRLGSAIRYRRDDLESYLSRSAANPSSGRHDENSER